MCLLVVQIILILTINYTTVSRIRSHFRITRNTIFHTLTTHSNITVIIITVMHFIHIQITYSPEEQF
jgi:hypothetical protein